MLSSCGKKDDGGGDKEKVETAANEKSTDEKKVAKKIDTCSEKNAVEIAWGEGEMYSPGEFKHTHTVGYLSGMVYGKTLHKIGYLVLANYDVKLREYMIELPKEEGQQAIVIQFKTAKVPTTVETNKDDYAKLSLVTGEQKQSPGDEMGYDIMYFVAGESSGPGISNQSSKGTATLTAVNGVLCGAIDFIGSKGTTIKGTFNTPILKDLWEK